VGVCGSRVPVLNVVLYTAKHVINAHSRKQLRPRIYL